MSLPLTPTSPAQGLCTGCRGEVMRCVDRVCVGGVWVRWWGVLTGSVLVVYGWGDEVCWQGLCWWCMGEVMRCVDRVCVGGVGVRWWAVLTRSVLVVYGWGDEVCWQGLCWWCRGEVMSCVDQVCVGGVWVRGEEVCWQGLCWCCRGEVMSCVDRVCAVNEMCQVTRSKSHDHTSNNAIYKTKLEFKSPSISSHSQFNQPDRVLQGAAEKKHPRMEKNTFHYL